MFQRVPTGVPELDDVTEGELLEAGLFLGAGTHGSAKDLPAIEGLIIETVAKVRNAGDIMIAITRPFSNTLRALSSASDVRLKFAQYDDVPCLLGVKSRTDYYGVSRPEKNWKSQIELVQVS